MDWLSSTFLGELQPARRAQLEQLADLEARLAAFVDAGHAAFPDIAIDAARFMRHLATIIDEAEDAPDLDTLHTDELYLACACAHGDPVAVATFERDYISTLDAPLRATGLTAADADDVRQRVRELLLVGNNDVPGIAGYRGKGQLRSWLRAVAVRQAMQQFRGKRETPVDDTALEGLTEAWDDGRLASWKQHYAVAFRAAFEQAIAALSHHDRVLLRQHHLDHLSIDQLAGLYKIHRATAARQVAAARAALLAGVRAKMIETLAVSAGELDSALRLARSQLEVSFGRLLAGKRPRKT